MMLKTFLVFVVFLCYFGRAMPPNSIVARNLINGKGLYDEGDKVAVLNVTNFKNTVFGTKNAWVVQFYNSWCGHCFAFAPKYKALAADVQGWNKVIKLGTIDCSAEVNNPVCRDYEILGYPTLKFFPAQAPLTDPGTEIGRETIGAGNPSEITRAIVGILRKEQVEGRGTHWPNITPLRSSDHTPLQSDAARYTFLVFEQEDSSLGTELILDFSSMEQVEIRTVLSENEALVRTMGIHRFPNIVHVTHGRAEPEFLRPVDETRGGFRNAIRAFLSSKGVVLPKEEPRVVPTVPDLDLTELMRLNHAKTQLRAIKSAGDVVFLADLETALRYMLTHEIPMRKVISGPAFDALKGFLNVIAKYFPTGEAGIQYLQNLRDSVETHTTEIRGLKFKTLVKQTGNGIDSVLSTRDGWLGCQGSEPHLRGFPCGVWTLFHYLTVSAVRSSDPLEVLSAMLGYITHFFGCTTCSEHFQEMAGRSMRAKVTDTEQSVLWLWSAHNEVNQRLSGAATDDPEFPKTQYPSSEHCPNCRDSSSRWNDHFVLNYLKEKYHQDNLNYQGADAQTALNARAHSPSIRKLVETVEERQLVGKYFNSLDISICIALYVLSGLICAAVCWKFILRKHYHRRKLF